VPILLPPIWLKRLLLKQPFPKDPRAQCSIHDDSIAAAGYRLFCTATATRSNNRGNHSLAVLVTGDSPGGWCWQQVASLDDDDDGQAPRTLRPAMMDVANIAIVNAPPTARATARAIQCGNGVGGRVTQIPGGVGWLMLHNAKLTSGPAEARYYTSSREYVTSSPAVPVASSRKRPAASIPNQESNPLEGRARETIILSDR
jgi:hypothetical protein